MIRVRQSNPPRPTAHPPAYCQVVRPVPFPDNDPNFSLDLLEPGKVGLFPPSSAGAAQASPELTEKVTAAPEYATPTVIEGGNHILNLSLPTVIEDQELPADTDSDITPLGSFWCG